MSSGLKKLTDLLKSGPRSPSLTLRIGIILASLLHPPFTVKPREKFSSEEIKMSVEIF